MSGLLIDCLAGGIVRLLINRPQARNAIDAGVRADLLTALDELQRDASVRALIIGGAQGFFCAGGDLPTMVGITDQVAESRLREGYAIVASLWRYHKPVVMALEGAAVGAGAGLALLGDHIVMAKDARIILPFFKVGLVPDWGLTVSLPARTGAGRAQQLFTESSTLDADAAARLNIVDTIVDPELVMERAMSQAEKYADLPPLAFARMKKLCRPSIRAELDAERASQQACMLGDEFSEGYAALQEKRPANFRRRGVDDE